MPSVAVVVVDESASQTFGDRPTQTDAARAAVVERLGHVPDLQVRVVEAGQVGRRDRWHATFSALDSTLSDVPADRVAGAIFVTDGRVHDIPPDAGALGFNAPVHALITGNTNERDRRVVLVTTPRFGIVGQTQTVTFRVEDEGGRRHSATSPCAATAKRSRRGVSCPAGRSSVDVPIPHAGPNIVEIEASPLAGELTPVNNRAVVSIDGVRDKLRVLFVSGEPHVGERTWRNLLKSDASRRSRAFHDFAAAGKAGRHADQRIVADRLPDARTLPAEDPRVSAHHLRPLRPPGRAADALFRQHRALCAERRRGVRRRRPRLCEPDQPVAYAARCDPAGRADRLGHRTQPFSRASRMSASAIRSPAISKARKAIRRIGVAGSAWSIPRMPRHHRDAGAGQQPLLVLSREGEGRVALLLCRPDMAVGARF